MSHSNLGRREGRTAALPPRALGAMADFARHYWTALPDLIKTTNYRSKGLIGRADLEEAGPVCGTALDAGGSPPRDVVFLRTEPERFSDGVVLREGLALRCRLHGGDAARLPPQRRRRARRGRRRVGPA